VQEALSLGTCGYVVKSQAQSDLLAAVVAVLVGRQFLSLGSMPCLRSNLEIVLASLNTVCPKCGYSITPDRIRRIDSQRVQCPECGERFIPLAKHPR